MIPGLAAKSLRNRKVTAGLTALSIALSVLLLLGVERIRSQARASFAAAVSGTDLLVGARTSPVHLLLSAVFHVGNATNNITWASYRALAQRPEVAWTIPLSLGDSHRGYRVVGTTDDCFRHLRYAGDRALAFEAGEAFGDDAGAVLGTDVARALRYRVGDAIVIAHGAGDVSFAAHDEHPFRVSGILARTGTPLDRSILVSLAGLDAVHEDAAADADPLAAIIGARRASVEPKAITAFLAGLKSRSAVLSVQRTINEYPAEPLTAVLPGVALQEVWEITGALERSLLAISALVVVVGLSGMLVSLLTSLGERRREMAVLRALGARPSQVFGLILGEAAFLTAAGIAAGMLALYAGLVAGRPWLGARFGLYVAAGWPSAGEWRLVGMVMAAGLAIGLLPAWRSYRYSLADGMIVRN
ncbi:MAG TPA: ABC transporter permease [Burkholderiales bacterium]|nr:ABC transporter permease [Burkholderiales bacterium]